MRFRSTAAATALLAAVTVALRSGTELLADRLAGGGSVPAWLPQLETIGWTVTAYSLASRAVAFALAVVGIALLGYWVGSRTDVRRDYRPLAGALLLGGGIGHLVGLWVVPVVALGTGVPASSASGVVLGAAGVLVIGLANGLKYALIGVAGAALAEFGAEVRVPGGSASSGTDARPDPE